MQSLSEQEKETRFCDCCREIFFTRGSRDIHENGMIQFPDMHFYDSNDIDICEDGGDLSAEQIDDILSLDSVEISEILTQDDPPKDLYLANEVEFRELPDEIDENTAWMIYYGEGINEFTEHWAECMEGFSLYEYFGIPNDTESDGAEDLPEATTPNK
jgi:hypothetical protein